MFKKLAVIILLALFADATAAHAQSLEDAIARFNDGKYGQAERQWQQLAETGDADALFNLGQMYRLGRGVAFNDNQAADYFLAAATLGHTAAARELGNLYFFSPSVSDGKAAAIKWWQQAAVEGDGQAQYILGILYFNGDNVEQDQVRGYAWTILAVEAGIQEAVQSQTAMRGQLTSGQHNAAFRLAQTLMTGTPKQASASLLVGERGQSRRPLAEGDRIAENAGGTTEPEMAEPEEEAITEIPVAESPLTEEAESVVPGDTPVTFIEIKTTPPQTADEPAIMTAEPVAVEAETPKKEMSSGDDFSETRQVLNALIDQTAHSGATPPGEEDYDLGDPNSQLVSDSNFSPDWSVQLTSFRKPENAEAHWLEVLAAYPDLFSGVEKRIVRYDLGPDRGVYYRLRIGPFADKAAADEKCTAIRDAGLDCLVIWP